MTIIQTGMVAAQARMKAVVTEGFKVDLGLNDRHMGKKKAQSVHPKDFCMKNAVVDDSAILLSGEIANSHLRKAVRLSFPILNLGD